MAMLTFDDRPPGLAAPPQPVDAPLRNVDEPDDEVQQRWLQSLPWPRRWFARFYRALRKLQPMFPPMSCC